MIPGLFRGVLFIFQILEEFPNIFPLLTFNLIPFWSENILLKMSILPILVICCIHLIIKCFLLLVVETFCNYQLHQFVCYCYYSLPCPWCFCPVGQWIIEKKMLNSLAIIAESSIYPFSPISFRFRHLDAVSRYINTSPLNESTPLSPLSDLLYLWQYSLFWNLLYLIVIELLWLFSFWWMSLWHINFYQFPFNLFISL